MNEYDYKNEFMNPLKFKDIGLKMLRNWELIIHGDYCRAKCIGVYDQLSLLKVAANEALILTLFWSDALCFDWDINYSLIFYSDDKEFDLGFSSDNKEVLMGYLRLAL